MKRAPGAKQECPCCTIIFKIITGMLSLTINGYSSANYFFLSFIGEIRINGYSSANYFFYLLLVKLGFMYLILHGMVIAVDHLLVNFDAGE